MVLCEGRSDNASNKIKMFWSNYCMWLNEQYPGSTGSKHLFTGRDFCKDLTTFSKALAMDGLAGPALCISSSKLAWNVPFTSFKTDFFFSRRKQVHKISPISYLLRYVVSSCSGFFHLMSPFHPFLVIIKFALIWGTCLDEKQQQQQCLGTSH